MESTIGLLFPEKIIGLNLKITYSRNIGGVAREEMNLVQLVIATVVRCGGRGWYRGFL